MLTRPPRLLPGTSFAAPALLALMTRPILFPTNGGEPLQVSHMRILHSDVGPMLHLVGWWGSQLVVDEFDWDPRGHLAVVCAN